MVKYIRLTKAPLAISVSLTGVLSYLLVRQVIDIEILYLFITMIFFGMFVCTINEIQEIKEDSLMVRTENRPLVNGDITVKKALFIALGLLLLSFVIAYFLIGFFAIVILSAIFVTYNLIYTPLKKVHEISVPIGAIVGIYPPLLGWIYAGGGYNVVLLFLMAYYFIWQMPHFWLLLLRYEKDYNRAGFKSLIFKTSPKTVGYLIFIWTIIYSLIVISLAYLMGISLFSFIIITMSAIAVDIYFIRYLNIGKLDRSSYRKSFLVTIFYCNLNIIIMVIDKFL